MGYNEDTKKLLKEAATKRQERDLEYWKQWKSDAGAWRQAPEDTGLKRKMDQSFVALATQMKPLIMQEPKKWIGGNVPPAAMEAEALYHFKNAIEKYDPARGAGLGTYVTNQLQQVRRFGYQNQNLISMPENRAIKIKLFKDAQADLMARYNRPATEEELADDLKWPVKEVRRMLSELRGDTIIEQSQFGSATNEGDRNWGKMELYYQGLDDEQKKVYDLTNGAHGSPELSVTDLAIRLGKTTGQVYEIRRKMGEDMAKFIS